METTQTRLNRFSLLVAGNNPDDLLKDYDNNKIVEKYVVYEFSKAEKLHKTYISAYENALKQKFSNINEQLITERLNTLKSQDDIDFFMDLTDGYDYDVETGDAISTKNPMGKWDKYEKGNFFSVLFKLFDGIESNCALKEEIDWKSINLANREIYESAWEMVLEGKKPITEDEKTIYENMKNRTSYFKSFGTKDNYVLNSTAFWEYAFLDENGWHELDDESSQTEWVTNYYNRFIKNLPDKTKLSVFECVRY